MEGVTPPKPFLSQPGKPHIPWSAWLFSFETYLSAMGGDSFVDSRRCSLLLHCIGAEAQRAYQALPASPKREGEMSYDRAKRLLTEYYSPRVNVTMERYIFRQRKQRSDESTADYVSVLWGLALSCKYGDLADELICDQVIEHTLHSRLRERLLAQENLSLDLLLTTAESFELSLQQAAMMCSAPAQDKVMKKSLASHLTKAIMSSSSVTPTNSEKRVKAKTEGGAKTSASSVTERHHFLSTVNLYIQVGEWVNTPTLFAEVVDQLERLGAEKTAVKVVSLLLFFNNYTRDLSPTTGTIRISCEGSVVLKDKPLSEPFSPKVIKKQYIMNANIKDIVLAGVVRNNDTAEDDPSDWWAVPKLRTRMIIWGIQVEGDGADMPDIKITPK